jgi:DNA invertase Pin-like site-specific DNA recombinase
MRVGYAIHSHHMTGECFDVQLSELTQAACGCLFTDQLIRGKITDRPGLSSALDYLRKDDVLVVFKLDRLGMTLPQLLELLMILEEHGVAFLSLRDHIDSTTPEGQMICRVLRALTSFEA